MKSKIFKARTVLDPPATTRARRGVQLSVLLIVVVLILLFSTTAALADCWESQNANLVPLQTNPLFSVSFADNQNGLAVGLNTNLSSGNTVLYHTTNGGRLWTQMDSGTREWLYGVSFPDVNHAWAVGHNGTILYYNALAHPSLAAQASGIQARSMAFASPITRTAGRWDYTAPSCIQLMAGRPGARR